MTEATNYKSSNAEIQQILLVPLFENFKKIENRMSPQEDRKAYINRLCTFFTEFPSDVLRSTANEIIRDRSDPWFPVPAEILTVARRHYGQSESQRLDKALEATLSRWSTETPAAWPEQHLGPAPGDANCRISQADLRQHFEACFERFADQFKRTSYQLGYPPPTRNEVGAYLYNCMLTSWFIDVTDAESIEAAAKAPHGTTPSQPVPADLLSKWHVPRTTEALLEIHKKSQEIMAPLEEARELARVQGISKKINYKDVGIPEPADAY